MMKGESRDTQGGEREEVTDFLIICCPVSADIYLRHESRESPIPCDFRECHPNV